MRKQAQIKMQIWQQTDKLYLVMNNGPLVVHLASRSVDLGANNAPLVIHLTALITTIILIISLVNALVSTISLVDARIDRTITRAISTSQNILAVGLNSDIPALINYLITSIVAIILIFPSVDALIPVVALVTSHVDLGPFFMRSLQILVIRLIISLINRIPGLGSPRPMKVPLSLCSDEISPICTRDGCPRGRSERKRCPAPYKQRDDQ